MKLEAGVGEGKSKREEGERRGDIERGAVVREESLIA